MLLLRGYLLGAIAVGLWAVAKPAVALPPPEELPEEVMRTEIILEARSPIDGQPLSPADYAALEEELRDPNRPVTLATDVRSLVQLLQIRRVVRPILPFIP